jgi:hypothetical protein
VRLKTSLSSLRCLGNVGSLTSDNSIRPPWPVTEIALLRLFFLLYSKRIRNLYIYIYVIGVGKDGRGKWCGQS